MISLIQICSCKLAQSCEPGYHVVRSIINSGMCGAVHLLLSDEIKNLMEQKIVLQNLSLVELKIVQRFCTPITYYHLHYFIYCLHDMCGQS